MSKSQPVFKVRDLDFYYGNFLALSQINIDIFPNCPNDESGYQI